MDDCIFCKIAKGEIPSSCVYEDEAFKVILDLNQSMKGHMLVIPKAHYENLFDLPEEIARDAMSLGQKAARAAKKALGCEGMNLLQNNGEIAGQSVMHFHLHVLPREKGDAAFPLWPDRSLSGDEMKQIALSIKESL